jgi:hypothetical protein
MRTPNCSPARSCRIGLGAGAAVRSSRLIATEEVVDGALKQTEFSYRLQALH